MNSLYHREGAYHYTKGVNPRAMVALVLGVAIALVGLVVSAAAFSLRLRVVRGLLYGGHVVCGDDEAGGAAPTRVRDERVKRLLRSKFTCSAI